nr:ORF6N domain-containing protein [uncultured Blautia sp.]
MQLPETIEVKGIKVLTTRQIAEAYGTTKDKIIYNFNYNKDKYILGKHYIEVFGEELRRLKRTCEIQSSFKYAKSLYLWTEKGALLHAKSLNTDKAWQVYDYLVDFYFRAKEKEPGLPPKREVVPTQTKTEPVKSKVAIPHMEEPIFVFKNLLALADEQGITLKLQDFKSFSSMLHGKCIGIRKQQLFEKVVYETAYELAHYFIHYNQGNLVKSPLEKDYNEQAERAAFMMIRMLDIKAKQKY